ADAQEVVPRDVDGRLDLVGAGGDDQPVGGAELGLEAGNGEDVGRDRDADPIPFRELEAVPLLLVLADHEVPPLALADEDGLLLAAVRRVEIGLAGAEAAPTGGQVAALVGEALVVRGAGGGRIGAERVAVVAHLARGAVAVGEAMSRTDADAGIDVAGEAGGAVLVREAFDAPAVHAGLTRPADVRLVLRGAGDLALRGADVAH